MKPATSIRRGSLVGGSRAWSPPGGSPRSIAFLAWGSLFSFLFGGAGCGGSSSGGGGGPGVETITVEGKILGTDGSPLSGVPVAPASGGGQEVRSSSDGVFSVVLERSDPRVKIGGPLHASYVVVLDPGAAPAESARKIALDETGVVQRPFFLESVASGIARAPVDVAASGLLVDDPANPGLALEVAPGGTVILPAGDTEVALVGLSGHRIPEPLPVDCVAAIAVFVGPRGVTFPGGAALRFPNLGGHAPGLDVDLFRLDETDGGWVDVGDLEVAVDGATIVGADIDEGGMYVPVPRIGCPVTNVRGRILGAGNEPQADFRIVLPGGRVAVSDASGFFGAAGVPAIPGRPLRIEVLSPPGLRHEFVVPPAIQPNFEPDVEGEVATDFGNISVAGVIDARFAPFVSFSPGSGATGVEEFPRIRVRFDRVMDPESLDILVVRGISRRQQGVAGTKLLRRFDSSTEIEFLPTSPLLNGEFYTVFVPQEASDLDGNSIDASQSSARFTVRSSTPDPGDRELRVFHVVPNEASAGDLVRISGVNLNTEDVRFGDVEAVVVGFDDVTRDFLDVRVPVDVVGEVVVRVRDLDGTLRGAVPFRAIPRLEIVESSDPGAGPAAIFGAGAHLGSGTRLLWNGLEGGTLSTISDASCPFETPERRRCLRVDLPADLDSGTLVFEVGGRRTEGVFVAARRAVDVEAPRVDSTTPAVGGSLATDEAILVRFSEVVAPEGRLVVLVADAQVDVDQTYSVRSDGSSEISVAPPASGWPDDAVVEVDAGAGIADLAGNPLEPFGAAFTVAAP